MLKISSNYKTQANFIKAYNSISEQVKEEPVVFKSYKSFVNYLGLPNLTNKTSQKNKQLNKLSEFFEFKRSGNSFIINAVKIPITIPPVYSLAEMTEKDIAPTFKLLNNYLILKLLKDHYNFTKENILVNSKKTLATELGYINPLFSKVSYSYETVADAFEIPYELSRSFFEVVSRSYGSLIEKSLEELQSYGLIAYQNVFYGRHHSTVVNSSNEIIQRKSVWGRLTDEELKIYVHAINEFYKLHGILTMQDVFLKGLKKEFYAFVDEYMESAAGISGVVKMIEIVFDNELIERCLKDTRVLVDITKEKAFLNCKFIEKQIKNFESREKNKKDMLNVGWGTMKMLELSPKERLSKFKSMCNALLSLNFNTEQLLFMDFI